MIISTISGIKLEAISACVPKNKIDNRKFAREHFDSNLESTIKALGCDERRIVKKMIQHLWIYPLRLQKSCLRMKK